METLSRTLLGGSELVVVLGGIPAMPLGIGVTYTEVVPRRGAGAVGSLGVDHDMVVPGLRVNVGAFDEKARCGVVLARSAATH